MSNIKTTALQALVNFKNEFRPIELSETTRSYSRKIEHRARNRNGFWCGSCPPQGYLMRRNKNGIICLVRDPERFEFIQSVLKGIAYNGYTLEDAKRIFDESTYMVPKYGKIEPHKLKSMKRLRKLLCNPVYAGFIVDIDDKTTFHKGHHEAMISADEWIEVIKRINIVNIEIVKSAVSKIL